MTFSDFKQMPQDCYIRRGQDHETALILSDFFLLVFWDLERYRLSTDGSFPDMETMAVSSLYPMGIFRCKFDLAPCRRPGL